MFDQPRIQLAVDRTKAVQSGFTPMNVASDLLVSLSGSFQVTPSYWLDPRSGITYSVVAQTPQYAESSLSDLENIPIDPQNGQQSLFDFKFGVSYGDPQEVRVLAKRSLGAVTLQYQVNGGAVQTGPTSDWNGGERYGPGHGAYYHVVKGSVTGTAPGDSVKVWFTGGGETSPSFTYKVQSDSGRRVARSQCTISPPFARRSAT